MKKIILILMTLSTVSFSHKIGINPKVTANIAYEIEGTGFRVYPYLSVGMDVKYILKPIRNFKDLTFEFGGGLSQDFEINKKGNESSTSKQTRSSSTNNSNDDILAGTYVSALAEAKFDVKNVRMYTSLRTLIGGTYSLDKDKKNSTFVTMAEGEVGVVWKIFKVGGVLGFKMPQPTYIPHVRTGINLSLDIPISLK